MKLYPLTTTMSDMDALLTEYKSAREFGNVRIGEQCIYYRKGLKTIYVPYSSLTHVFRRVLLVSARMCCGKGDIHVDHLVLCNEQGELVQLQLPGEKAAKAALVEIGKFAPNVQITKPVAKTAEEAVKEMTEK